MIRWRMFKACAKELIDFMIGSNMLFVFMLIIKFCVNDETPMKNSEYMAMAIAATIPCFVCSVVVYKTYLHDIIFKRIETVDACIYHQQKYITSDARSSLIDSKKNLPSKQFRLWTQSVDEDGNLIEYKNTYRLYARYPNGNQFMSYDFKLYELLEEKTRQIPKIKVSKKREPSKYKKEELLYVRILYMKSTNMIVDIEFLGQKMNKVGA